jgi:hypothetical protein
LNPYATARTANSELYKGGNNLNASLSSKPKFTALKARYPEITISRNHNVRLAGECDSAVEAGASCE